MNVSLRYWSSIDENECVFCVNEQQKVYITPSCTHACDSIIPHIHIYKYIQIYTQLAFVYMENYTGPDKECNSGLSVLTSIYRSTLCPSLWWSLPSRVFPRLEKAFQRVSWVFWWLQCYWFSPVRLSNWIYTSSFPVVQCVKSCESPNCLWSSYFLSYLVPGLSHSTLSWRAPTTTLLSKRGWNLYCASISYYKGYSVLLTSEYQARRPKIQFCRGASPKEWVNTTVHLILFEIYLALRSATTKVTACF